MPPFATASHSQNQEATSTSNSLENKEVKQELTDEKEKENTQQK